MAGGAGAKRSRQNVVSDIYERECGYLVTTYQYTKSLIKLEVKFVAARLGDGSQPETYSAGIHQPGRLGFLQPKVWPKE
jgi:hypothetical protein